MHSRAAKNIERLEEGLQKNLSLDFFDDDEIAAVFRDIGLLDPLLRQKALALCFTLSGASSSLVPNTLKRLKKASLLLSFHDMERWMASAFDLLDSRGVDPFLKFIGAADEASLRAFRNPEGLRLKDLTITLETYLRGISGNDLKVAEDKESYTDTVIIFLPPAVNLFGEPEKDFLIYKLMAAYKWAQISQGTLTPHEHTLRKFFSVAKSARPDIDGLFRLFQEKELAIAIYNVIESFRLETFLRRELPGLMNRSDIVVSALFRERPSIDLLPEKSAFVEGLYHFFLGGSVKGVLSEALKKAVTGMEGIRQAHSSDESIRLLMELYDVVSGFNGDYRPVDPPLLLGTIKPESISRRLKAERDAKKKQLEGIISGLMNASDDAGLTRVPSAEARFRERLPKPESDYLIINGRLIELDNEIRELLDEMSEIPGGILVKGSDIGAARHCISLREALLEEDSGALLRQHGGIKYDEWDYRRGGYKKRWCSLYEKDIHPGHEPFVESTLLRYGGYVTVLRKKFELLKREPKILRRQREGDEIDIDATVEALTDIRAGLSPNENFFTRLDRYERNIAVLFLLDMSGSTKGWVNEAEKESLVLLCEALEALGDRYAVYGFSGMTRTRCDYYTIKSFGDLYSDVIKKRIAGISPRDYTRMGPPLRHSIHILKGIEARTKLLITLSDGKPEDWDAYKGDVGIEDTRKALLEAREQGIHSFCITIDKQASSYLPRMYGEAKYIIINDVRELPHRITEIYRMLTA